MSEKATILCVEDETMLLEDLKEELEEAGYRVLTAENGNTAVTVLEKHKPDLILSDMMMPVMDGPALLKHVRDQLPKLSDVPFIFLTAKATRENLIEGKRLGVDDYLTKPVDYDLLLATVEASLAQMARIRQRTQQKLQQIYELFQKQHKVQGPLRVQFVTGNHAAVQPISVALNELGCAVTIVPEAQLAKKAFSVRDSDIVFLVYSKIVHYYLNYVTSEAPQDWGGVTVLLAPPKLSAEQKEALLQAGVNDFIEYPYPPVEVFKLIMKRMQKAA